MIMTSSPNIEGYNIVQYLGHFSVPVVIGTGIFSNLDTSIADFLGSHGTSYMAKLERAEYEGKNYLMQKAASIGGNAVISIDVDYTTFSNDVIGVIVGGTVVKAVKSIDQQISKSFVSNIYSPDSELVITDVDTVQIINSNKIFASIRGKKYCSEDITAIELIPEYTTIFSEKKHFPEMQYTELEFDDEGNLTSEYIELPIDIKEFKAINLFNLHIKRYIKENEVVENNHLSDSISEIDNRTMMILRKKYGSDSFIIPFKKEGHWYCTCGTRNSLNDNKCIHCHKEIDLSQLRREYAENSSKEDFSLIDHMYKLESFDTAREIYDYIEKISKKNPSETLDHILHEMNNLVRSERLYGNMKESAIQQIQKILS